MLNKWLADWHWANSVTDPVLFLFCQTSCSLFNSVNYQSPLSNLVSLAPPPRLSLSSVIKYRRFGLIFVIFFKGSAHLHSSVQISSAYIENKRAKVDADLL